MHCRNGILKTLNFLVIPWVWCRRVPNKSSFTKNCIARSCLLLCHVLFSRVAGPPNETRVSFLMQLVFEVRAALYNDWCAEWINSPSNLEENGLTREQKKRMSSSNRTSAFTAYLKNTYGGKFWVMALWHEGLSWVPTRFESIANKSSGSSGASEHRSSSCSGALGASEHRSSSSSGAEQGPNEAIDAFCMWLARVVIARTNFQLDEQTQIAQQKSGHTKYESGLTSVQKEKRDRYHHLTEQKSIAMELDAEDRAYKKWCDTRQYPSDSKFEHQAPRPVWWMAWWEQHLLTWWRSGNLQKEYIAAQRDHRSTGSSIAKPCGMDNV